jgi:hypothetical protein
VKISRKQWLIGGGAAAGLLALTMTYRTVYSVPRDEIQGEIEGIGASIDRLQGIIDRRKEAEAKIRAVAASTLGDQLDVVEHRLRTGLNRVMEQEGMQGIVIDTFQPREEENPLTRSKGVPPTVKKLLNADPDFIALRASVKGVGTLEQVSRCIAVIQAQPWLHRVDSFAVRPLGKERERFELRLDVASLFMPQWVPKDLPDPVVAQVGEDGAQYAAAMAARNVFRRAQPPDKPIAEAAAPVDPAVPAPPVVFPPYEDWALSGVMSGRSGLSVVMVNRKSGESLAVRPGERVLDAVLIGGSGERAVFEIGGQRFELSNGETLASRRPIG